MRRVDWSVGVIWLRWLLATAAGWVFGFALAVLLSELLLMPVLHDETNLIVGLCLGGCTGALQVRAIRPQVRLRQGWVWGGMVIAGPAFIMSWLGGALKLDAGAMEVQALFWSVVVLFGVAGAVLQAYALRPHVERWPWWVGAAVLSWGLTTLSSLVLGFLAGGIVLGSTGGALMVWFLRYPVAARDDVSGGTREVAQSGPQLTGGPVL